jgi:LPXTG-site transpeptidase (sortase) family protein
VLLSAMLILGGMEASTAVGVPSPGEAILSMAKAATPSPRASAAAVSSADNVSIPRLGLRVRLVEGSSMKALAKGAWRQPPSLKPGQKGTSVIAGHRVSSQFRNLSKVRVGDVVRVTARGRVYKYRVASVTTKRAGKGLYFRTGVKEKLVLYTCVPRWQGDKRTIVVCLPVTK